MKRPLTNGYSVERRARRARVDAASSSPFDVTHSAFRGLINRSFDDDAAAAKTFVDMLLSGKYEAATTTNDEDDRDSTETTNASRSVRWSPISLIAERRNDDDDSSSLTRRLTYGWLAKAGTAVRYAPETIVVRDAALARSLHAARKQQRGRVPCESIVLLDLTIRGRCDVERVGLVERPCAEELSALTTLRRLSSRYENEERERAVAETNRLRSLRARAERETRVLLERDAARDELTLRATVQRDNLDAEERELVLLNNALTLRVALATRDIEARANAALMQIIDEWKCRAEKARREREDALALAVATADGEESLVRDCAKSARRALASLLGHDWNDVPILVDLESNARVDKFEDVLFDRALERLESLANARSALFPEIKTGLPIERDRESVIDDLRREREREIRLNATWRVRHGSVDRYMRQLKYYAAWRDRIERAIASDDESSAANSYSPNSYSPSGYSAEAKAEDENEEEEEEECVGSETSRLREFLRVSAATAAASATVGSAAGSYIGLSLATGQAIDSDFLDHLNPSIAELSSSLVDCASGRAVRAFGYLALCVLNPIVGQ